MSTTIEFSTDLWIHIMCFADTRSCAKLRMCAKKFASLEQSMFIARAMMRKNFIQRICRIQKQARKWASVYFAKKAEKRVRILEEVHLIDKRDAMFYLDFLTV